MAPPLQIGFTSLTARAHGAGGVVLPGNPGAASGEVRQADQGLFGVQGMMGARL
jgi:hypothetical protein